MDINDNDFEEKVIEQSRKKLVIVDFWASWCMPCTMLGPILEKVAEDFKDKVVLAKVNVDENPDKSGKYNINAIPAVKFFKDGEVVDEFVGLQPEDKIRKMIEKNL